MNIPKRHDEIGTLIGLCFAGMVTTVIVLSAILFLFSPSHETETIVPARLLPVPDPMSVPDPEISR